MLAHDNAAQIPLIPSQLHFTINSIIFITYRAVSQQLCGDQDNMHTELRVRVVCELVCHEEYYMQPEIISFLDASDYRASTYILPTISGSYARAVREAPNKDVALTVFKDDCIDTTVAGKFSLMWHIYALSSVLRSTVRSVYPENISHGIRPMYNKLVQPRIMDPHNMNRCITIMWTRTSPSVPRPRSPNHFVLCIPKLVQPPHMGLPYGSNSNEPSSQSSLK